MFKFFTIQIYGTYRYIISKSNKINHMIQIICFLTLFINNNLSEPPCDKTNKMTVRPAKTQISLGIRPVRSVFAVRSIGS